MSKDIKTMSDMIYKVRICPRCKAVNIPMTHVCRNCGMNISKVPLTDKVVKVIRNDNKIERGE